MRAPGSTPAAAGRALSRSRIEAGGQAWRGWEGSGEGVDRAAVTVCSGGQRQHNTCLGAAERLKVLVRCPEIGSNDRPLNCTVYSCSGSVGVTRALAAALSRRGRRRRRLTQKGAPEVSPDHTSTPIASVVARSLWEAADPRSSSHPAAERAGRRAESIRLKDRGGEMSRGPRRLTTAAHCRRPPPPLPPRPLRAPPFRCRLQAAWGRAGAASRSACTRRGPPSTAPFSPPAMRAAGKRGRGSRPCCRWQAGHLGEHQQLYR